MVAFNDAEGIRLSKLAKKVTLIWRRETTIVGLRKRIPNLSREFGKEYRKKAITKHIVHLVKDLIGYDFQTGRSTQFYSLYSRVARLILRNKSVVALVESQIVDDTGSSRPGISHLQEMKLYPATWSTASSQWSGKQLLEEP